MPLSEAILSLQGLSVGDAFGQVFYGEGDMERIAARRLPPGPWRWTDDTHMALSIVEVLREHGRIDPDDLAQRFARRFAEDHRLGYAGGAAQLLTKIYRGEDWRKAAPALFHGGSYGNGGAMRAAPIGGFFAGDPERAAQEARLSAEVTHAHPEGQAGTMAVAAAAALAAKTDRPEGVGFLERVLKYVPHGETRLGIERALDIPAEDRERAAEFLGTGDRVTAQDTVPFCLWCAAYHLEDYQAALWWTVAGLGDRDTTCAIVGGIVALSARALPAEWLRSREPLPAWF